MNRIVLVSLVFITLTFQSCENHAEHGIKEGIAKFEDKWTSILNVKLMEKDTYYLGFRGDVNDAYFLAYKTSESVPFDICKVFTVNNWDKNDSINKIIIEANRRLRNVGLKTNIIYDEKDSLEIVLLDIKNLSIKSVSTIKSIKDLIELNKYKPSVME